MKYICEKLFSGRWICTITVCIVLVICVVKNLLPGEAIASIISSTVAFYFLRNDRNGTKLKGQI